MTSQLTFGLTLTYFVCLEDFRLCDQRTIQRKVEELGAAQKPTGRGAPEHKQQEATMLDPSIAALSGGSRLLNGALSVIPEEHVPAGYLTVGQWWENNEEGAIGFLTNPALTYFQDSEKLQTICEERHIPFVWVKASPLMKSLGLEDIRAFPEWLLSEFYPLNP